ncbi:ribokinase [Faunimonas pinastri]|uniref:Ribokinase n=1 Tax=Faunimonas pinastri TaxID=1855383 RepID=A0A1H9A3Q5_9HYPH|nr:ribokinase [Faunimonas pinastri]SEP71309.1 ribokinase [Faunimonas pinastri]
MIVVFGSVNIDLVTRVQRLPTGGETVQGSDYFLAPGGKGANQALAARRMGSEVAMVGRVGRDAFADLALALLREGDVNLSAMAPCDRPTGAAFITVEASSENQIVIAPGANGEARADALDALSVGAGDTLLLQREVPDAETWKAVGWAKARGMRTVLNLAPAGAVPLDVLQSLDILVMNESEAGILGAELGIAGSADEIAGELAARFGLAVVVTLGGEGALAVTRDGRFRIASFPVSPVDTTAAGDSFVGAFAAGLDEGFGFAWSLTAGCAAGSLACTVEGAQPSIPVRSEVLRLVESREIGDS